MNIVKLTKRRLRKIKSIKDMEKMFHFDAAKSAIHIHPETYEILFIKIKKHYEKNLPKNPFTNMQTRARTQLEIMKTEFILTPQMKNNRILIKKKM